jgi:ribosomal protein S18 acetylase RimI-like enzyme
MAKANAALNTTGVELTIRPMQPGDLPEVVAAHLQSFPGFFLTFLGPEFLKLLYQNIMLDKDGIALVACDNNRINGFVAGVLHQSGFYRQLVKRHKWAFARASLGAILKKPSIMPRLWRALRRSAEARASAADACLMSIAVRPESEGQGIGQQLVRAFCWELDQRSIPAVCLTTDHDHNERVNQFYQRLGFQLYQVFTTLEGRAMNEYVISLPMKEHHA